LHRRGQTDQADGLIQSGELAALIRTSGQIGRDQRLFVRLEQAQGVLGEQLVNLDTNVGG